MRCLSIAIVACAVVLPVLRAEDVNAVVAVVNDEIITQGELNRLLAPAIKMLSRKYSGDTLRAAMRPQYDNALNRLIDKRLLIQEGKRMIAAQEVQPRLIDQNIDSIIKDLIAQAGSLLQLKKILAKGGETLESKRERTRNEILIQMVLQKNVYGRAGVSPREIREYYRKHASDYIREKKVKSRHIVIPFGAAATRDKTKALAMSIHQELVAGADFAAMAKKRSRGPHAGDGGLWDFMKRPAFGGKIDDALFSMAKGEISPVIETSRGFQIVQVVDVQPGGKVPFEDAETEIKEHLKGERTNREYQAYLSSLRSKSYIVRR